MQDNILTFPGVTPRVTSYSGEPLNAARVDWRTRQSVQADIDRHVKARDAYGKAVAWTIAAEAQNLPQANIEAAKEDVATLYEEMRHAAVHLLIGMPTDPKGLVDVLMYLEKHFSTLPQEMCGRSLAFELLKTVRLSLRAVAKYGKYGPDDERGGQ